ncbi:methyl-accepting chemotaxis protein [Rossellomorea sp. AcN35-11]|nr:methyl-accepting chemotaxis protein [Rossellomorea aquimaris]WJV30027.1 methyl-accepting chemotaxis protein [Rossellomorea sp. AcN35-11]
MGEKKIQKRTLRTFLTGLFTIIIASLFIISGILIYLTSNKSIYETISQNTILHAERIASEIDEETYKRFLANPVKDDTYSELRELLNEYREKIGAQYVYTLQVTDQQVAIMVDGFPTNDEAVPVGEPTTATTYEDVAPVLDGGVNSTDIVHDPEYGDYLSTFVPIKGSDGSVMAILGVDMDAEEVGTINKEVIISSIPVFLGLFIVVFLLVVTFVYYYLGKRLKPLSQLNNVAMSIKDGDVSHAKQQLKDIDNKYKDEIVGLTQSMTKMTESLDEVLHGIRQVSTNVDRQGEVLRTTSDEMSQGSFQIAATMEEMAAGAESQAQLSGDISGEMEELTSLINQSRDQGEHLYEASSKVENNAQTGSRLMKDSIDKMENIYQMVNKSVDKVQTLESQTNEVTSLVTLISQIADQTNLLALNAAIEAARAGEHGKGFAVVADEVRKLAESVSSSVNSIHDIVNNVRSNSNEMAHILLDGLEVVENGRKNLNETGVAFGDISMTISNMNGLVESMGLQLEKVGAKQVNMKESIEQIAAISEENAAGIEQVSASTQQMSGSTEEMNRFVEELVRMSEELRGLNDKFK